MLKYSTDLLKDSLLSDFQVESEDRNKEPGKVIITYTGKYSGYYLRANYANEMKNGQGDLYNNKGIRIASITFVNDTINGPYDFFDKDGIVLSGYMKNGLRHGICSEYGESKEVELFGRYYDNIKVSSIKKKDGIFCEYNLGGELIFAGILAGDEYKKEGSGVEYKDNRPVMMGEFKNDVIVKCKKEFTGDVMVEYYDNGNKAYEGGYCNNYKLLFPRNGYGEEYKDDIIVYEGQWSNNKREGKGTEYVNGNVLYVGSWKNGLPNGDGILMKADGKTKEYKGHFVNGYYNYKYYTNGKVLNPGCYACTPNEFVVTNREAILNDGYEWLWSEAERNKTKEKEEMKQNTLTTIANPMIPYTWIHNGSALNTMFDKIVMVRFAANCCKDDVINVLDLSKYRLLKGVIIDKNSFIHKTQSLIIRNLDYLESISIGEWCFHNVHDVAIENLPRLLSFTMDGWALEGEDSIYRREKSSPPFYYKNSIILRNLPLLSTFNCFASWQCFCMGHVYLENIPLLKITGIISGLHQFENCYDLQAYSADALRDLVVKKATAFRNLVREPIEKQELSILAELKLPRELLICSAIDLQGISREIEDFVCYEGCCYNDEIKEMDLRPFKHLKRIVLGKHCFQQRTRNLIIKDMPFLESIEMGEYCFREIHSITFENLPILRSIILKSWVFYGDIDEEQSEKKIQQSANLLVMKKLPSLAEITFIGYYQFCHVNRAELEDVSALEEGSITIIDGYDQFENCHDVQAHNADELKAFILSKHHASDAV